MNLAILHDAVADNPRPDELDVLTQAAAIESALADLGHTSTRVAFGLNVAEAAETLRRLRPDRVFNIVESVAGHGRLIHFAPALLDALALPYTGASADAMYVTSNKLLCKTLLRGAGLPTADWFTAETSADGDLWHRFPTGDCATGFQPVAPFQPGRYIIKSVWEHASVGLGDDAVITVNSLDALRAEIRRRTPALGGQAFAEPYIHGREFNIALLTRGPDAPPQVLPHAEILFDGYASDKPMIVDYRAKWDESSYAYHHTPRRFEFPAEDRPLLDSLTDLCLNCWRTLPLRGYARVDFRIDEQGRPFILEINTNPCLSPDAGYAAALAQAGIPFPEAIRRILSDI